MNNKVLNLSVIIILSISIVMFPASTDIKSEELIEGVFLEQNHDPWDVYTDRHEISEVWHWLTYEDYFFPHNEEYRKKLIEYQSKTRFSPDSLARLISSKDWHGRTTGIFLAIKQDEKSLLPDIRNMIKDMDQLVRYNAIKALRELDKSLPPEFFISILKNSDEKPYARAAAISVLIPWIKKDIYPHIKNLTGINDPMDYWIGRAIGEINIPEGYPLLMEMTTSDDIIIIHMALENLEIISGSEVLTNRITFYPRMEEDPVFAEDAIVCTDIYDEIHTRIRHATEDYFKKYGKENIVNVFHHKDYKVRKNAVLATMYLFTNEFEDELLELGFDKNWRVVYYALPALGLLHSEKAYNVIKQQLHNKEGIIKQVAYGAAATHGSIKFYDDFIKGLKDTDYSVRASSVLGLREIKNPSSIPYLRNAFAIESVEDLRFDLITCLKKQGYIPATKKEVLYNKIYSNTLDIKDLMSIRSIKVIQYVYNAKYYASDIPDFWLFKSLKGVTELFSNHKEPGIFLAENFTEFSANDRYTIYNNISHYSPNAVIPLLIKYLDHNDRDWVLRFDVYIELSKILGISDFDIQEIKTIWSGVLKKAKTPQDYPLLIKEKLKKYKPI